MENPRKQRLLIATLSFALFCSLMALAWALWQNFWWQKSVDYIADQAGVSWAMSSFRQGRLALWELNPTNDFPRFSGRREGPFDIWLDEYHAEMPGPWHYMQNRKIEAHNRQMRLMYDHPERFTLGVDERK
jgi:hypothetical protein